MTRRQKPPRPEPSSQVDRRKTTSTRITAETRARLEEAAADSGRSLAQEIEFRLAWSFAKEKSQAEISDGAVGGFYASFGNLETFLVARVLANAIQTIEAVTGKNWMDDPEVHRQTQVACIKILDAFRPPVGARSISTDLIFEGLVAAESSTVGTDAATKALMSAVAHAPDAAKFFRMKKKGE